MAAADESDSRLIHEQVFRETSIEDLSTELAGLVCKQKVIKERLQTLKSAQKPTSLTDHSAIIQDDVLLSQVATTISSKNLYRFAFGFLGLTPPEIANASGVMLPTVYEKAVEALHWWVQKNSRHNVGRIRREISRAVEQQILEKEMLDIFANCNENDSINNELLDQLAVCFTPSAWNLFSKSYLALPPAFSSLGRLDEERYIQKQALGILQVWRDKPPAKTVKHLLDVLNRAHNEGVLNRQSVQVVDAGYAPSVTTEGESVSNGSIRDKPDKPDNALAKNAADNESKQAAVQPAAQMSGGLPLTLPKETLVQKLQRVETDPNGPAGSPCNGDVDYTVNVRDYHRTSIDYNPTYETNVYADIDEYNPHQKPDDTGDNAVDTVLATEQSAATGGEVAMQDLKHHHYTYDAIYIRTVPPNVPSFQVREQSSQIGSSNQSASYLYIAEPQGNNEYVLTSSTPPGGEQAAATPEGHNQRKQPPAHNQQVAAAAASAAAAAREDNRSDSGIGMDRASAQSKRSIKIQTQEARRSSNEYQNVQAGKHSRSSEHTGRTATDTTRQHAADENSKKRKETFKIFL